MTDALGSATEIVYVAAGVVQQDGRYLIAKRPRGTHLEGLWEFPGGKREPGETMEACLRRELWEELAVRIADPVLLCVLRHEYPEKTVELHFFRCRIVHGEARASAGSELRWATAMELSHYAFPPADRPVIAVLQGAEISAR